MNHNNIAFQFDSVGYDIFVSIKASEMIWSSEDKNVDLKILYDSLEVEITIRMCIRIKRVQWIKIQMKKDKKDEENEVKQKITTRIEQQNRMGFYDSAICIGDIFYVSTCKIWPMNERAQSSQEKKQKK